MQCVHVPCRTHGTVRTAVEVGSHGILARDGNLELVLVKQKTNFVQLLTLVDL